MHIVILGDGPMGRCAAEELRAAGHEPTVLGRPKDGRHALADLASADVVVDFSTAPSVLSNVAALAEAGGRRLVIGTTGWGADNRAVEDLLMRHDVAAVVSPTFSPGAAILIEAVEQVARRIAGVGGYDPFIVEWHRAGKRDRPSGTALELARRVIAAYPAKREVASNGDGPAEPEGLEVLSLRAGAAPGTHLVGFDAAGETLELRLAARDRRSYAAGARLSAEWLAAGPRQPGSHPFTSVLREGLTHNAERIHP